MRRIQLKTEISQEKRDIIDHDGNVLVIANPGTGKTLLLAYKFIDLLNRGLGPADILCLTFTNKAKMEMEERIVGLLKEQKRHLEYIPSLNIFTFHSYCMNHLDDADIISTNLLRYTIFKYLREREVLNYGDAYLVENIVPKMDTLIRYLKSFGVRPDMIDADAVKPFLSGGAKYDTDDLERFLVDFIQIYRDYESSKAGRGCDYADLLLDFLELKRKPHFSYVLIDELQDVNRIEADIALMSADIYFAVGDPKQAIFGFQGGSIINFGKFSNSKRFILTENFRSTDQILEFARTDFTLKTKDEDHREALMKLKNANGAQGDKPAVINVSKEHLAGVICTIINRTDHEHTIAVIARTNYQLMKLAKDLCGMGIDTSPAFISITDVVKEDIIRFIRGILSDDVEDVMNAMFTPYSPVSLQEAFLLSRERGLTLEKLLALAPCMKTLKEDVVTIEDLSKLFRKNILPIAFSYGEEYVRAANYLHETCADALRILKEKTLANLIVYLKSSDMATDGAGPEKRIVLTTVHKAKGKQYDTVIYIPSKTRNRADFQDAIVNAILAQKGIDAKEELEEESLRVNFVAITRAKKMLWILTDGMHEFLNEEAEECHIDKGTDDGEPDTGELSKRAFSLFVNGRFDEARAALATSESWLLGYVKNHFDGLDRISFSRLKNDAYAYLTQIILKLAEPSAAASLGSEVHTAAEMLLRGEVPQVREETSPYVENIKQTIEALQSQGYTIRNVEYEILQPLKDMIGTDTPIHFKGIIDAVFERNGDLLIVDWKTSKNRDYASEYRQQLEAYRRILSTKENIPLDRITASIAFVGLRKKINDGSIDSYYDDKQPAARSFETLTKRINGFLSWRNDPRLFLQEICTSKYDDALIRCIREQCEREGIL